MRKIMSVGIIVLFISLPTTFCNSSLTLYKQDETITLSPSEPNGENGWYVTPVEVTFHAKEGSASGISGLKYIYYCINNGSWIKHEIPGEYPNLPDEYNFSITMDSDGKYFISFKAEDWVGNVGSIHSIAFKIDMMPPYVSITFPIEGYISYGRCLMPRIFIKNVALLIGGHETLAKANDSVSGIWMVEFKRNGESFAEDAKPPYSAVMPSLPVVQFRYKLTATAIDYAGNYATAPIVNYTKIL